jgi:hypothetical protein
MEQKNTGLYLTELIQETKKQTRILEEIQATTKSNNDAILCIVAFLAEDLN